jgi:peroxiredoxin
MTGEKNRPHLWTLLFGVALVVLIVQNFLLVRKLDERMKEIESLRQALTSRNLMSEGDSISAFVALDLDSSLVRIIRPSQSEFRLLLVFTTWCHFCLENMAQWNQLVQETSSDNVLIVGVSPDPLYKIREYMIRVHPAFPVYSVSNDSSLLKRYEWNMFPQTILIDSAGVITRIAGGLLSSETRNKFKSAIQFHAEGGQLM